MAFKRNSRRSRKQRLFFAADQMSGRIKFFSDLNGFSGLNRIKNETRKSFQTEAMNDENKKNLYRGCSGGFGRGCGNGGYGRRGRCGR